MDKRFLQAFLTAKSTILLGKRLYPWCLKHRIQLAALGSPIVNGGLVTPFDLHVFVKVCSEEPFSVSPTIRERLQLRKLSKASAMMDAIKLSKEHMKLGDWPRFWEKKDAQSDGDGARGVPWALSVIANLVKHGVSHDEAIHLPEAYVLWLSTALGIHDGAKVDILTTEQEVMLDDLSRVGKPPEQ